MLWKKAVFLQQKILQNIVKTNVRNIYISKALKKSLYEVLGVEKTATLSEIKNAYFELSKIYHPDRIAATDENLAKFREISNAYEILGNEQARKLYDRGLFGDENITGTDAEVTDSIVKFYKERHQRSKIRTDEEIGLDLDAWTKNYYKETRRVTINKSDIFQASKYKDEEFENPWYTEIHITFILYVVVLSFYVFTLEHHQFRINFLKFKAWLSETLGN